MSKSPAPTAHPAQHPLLLALRTHALELVALLAYALGVWWRVKYITVWHDPRKFVYSDMKMYFDLGIRLAKPGYVPRSNDVTHPPGVSELIAFFARRDGERLGLLEAKSFVEELSRAALAGEALGGLVLLQLVLAIAVPLAVGFLGWVAFGRRTALIAVAVASLYYPFVEYGGYFLAEIYMMVLAPLVLGLYLLAVRVVERGGRRNVLVALGLGAVAGFLFFLTLAMKMVALPAVLGFLAVHFLFTRGPARTLRAAIIAVMLVSATPGTIGISQRCTAANDGTFCFGSNKSGADFLLGHYGRIQGISWKPKKGPFYSFGSPSAYQHGYRDVPEVPFGIFDSKANEAAAWKWIRKNPAQAVVLSTEHVADSFVGALPWPAYATNFWLGAQAALYLFILFLLFPTGILLVDVLRQRGLMGFLRSMELAIVSPIVGVCVAVAIATGEIRYRLPWDGVFMVLAIEWYRRLRIPFREPLATEADAPSGPYRDAATEEPPDASDDDPPDAGADGGADGGEDEAATEHPTDHGTRHHATEGERASDQPPARAGSRPD